MPKPSCVLSHFRTSMTKEFSYCFIHLLRGSGPSSNLDFSGTHIVLSSALRSVWSGWPGRRTSEAKSGFSSYVVYTRTSSLCEVTYL